MAVRDRTRIDRIQGAFQRGMSTEEVGRAFGISSVRVVQILRDSDGQLGREREPHRRGGPPRARASD